MYYIVAENYNLQALIHKSQRKWDAIVIHFGFSNKNNKFCWDWGDNGKYKYYGIHDDKFKNVENVLKKQK